MYFDWPDLCAPIRRLYKKSLTKQQNEHFILQDKFVRQREIREAFWQGICSHIFNQTLVRHLIL